MRDSDLEAGAACLTAAGYPKDKHSIVPLPAALDLVVQLPEHLRSVHEKPKHVVAAADRALPNSAVWDPLRVRVEELADARPQRLKAIEQAYDAMNARDPAARGAVRLIAKNESTPKWQFLKADPS